jgi:uncharacterized protein
MANRYRIENAERGTILATGAGRAASMLKRGIGLIGRATLPAGDGLIIQPCNSIVMFFMQFPIDVAFVDRDNAVVHMLHGIRPWRTSKIVRQARYVVELPEGTLQQTGTEIGDHLSIVPAS